ncbi:hypothetical protein BG000_002595 [Podila horticola]|nr:hypothetical protein BG000_002595 [Podila horticola]
MYSVLPGSQAEDSHVIVHKTDCLDQGNSQYPEQGDLLEPLKHLTDTCLYLYTYLANFTTGITDRFRQVTANTRYYHSLLAEEVERLDQAGVKTLINGKDRGQLLEVYRNIQEKATELEHRNTCYSTLFAKSSKWDYATSSLLIALPLDLNAWDDSDPLTHRLRIYYLCDNWIQRGARNDIPQHVHLCNHPGYDIKRQQEFIQTYGDYILRVLLLVRHGFSDDIYCVPPLETFKILWGCDPNVIGNHITNDTLGPLVNKAIAHLQELSPPKWKAQLGLSRIQSSAIKTHFDVKDDDGAHALQYLNTGSLEELKKFVCSRGGFVDMQQAKLGVNLGSSDEADEFRSLLVGPVHAFDMSVKLSWEATRSYVKRLCMTIANSGTVILELDGIILTQRAIQYLGNGKYIYHLFIDEIMQSVDVQFITLLNYPRPKEQWVELRSDLSKFGRLVDAAKDSLGWDEAAKELQSTLEKYGLAGNTVVTAYKDGWNAVFNQSSGALIELAISGSDVHHLGKSILDIDGCHAGPPVHQQAMDMPLNIEFMQWDCDHAFSPLSDYSVLFLDAATNQHPSVLTMFELDVSRLTCHGLASVQKILHRSSLEHLVIRCTPFERDLSDSVAKVLGAVSWSTLKSLVLSGINLNGWIDIWPPATAVQLHYLHIRGTWNGIHALSHSSVLFVHQLLSMSPQAELHLLDVQLQDERDCVLLAESMDPAVTA